MLFTKRGFFSALKSYLGFEDALYYKEVVSALKEAIFEIGGTTDIDVILQEIIRICVQTSNASRGAILLYDKDRGLLTIRAEVGHTPGYRFTGFYEVGDDPEKPKIGLTTYVFLTKKPFHLKSRKEIEQHLAFWGKYTRKRSKEFYGIPLINPFNEEESFGVLKIIVDEDKNTKFSETQIEVVNKLAKIAPKFIAVSRKRQNTLDTEINDIISVFEEKGTLEEKLKKITEIFKDISNAEATSIWVKEGDKLILKAGIGYYDKEKAKEKEIVYEYSLSFNPSTAEKAGLTAWIAKTGEKINIRSNEELKEHPQHAGKYDKINYPDKTQKKCNSFIGAPLQIGKEIIGVIKADNKIQDSIHPEKFFTQEEADIFYYLAIIAAIVIKIDQISEERQRISEEASKMTIQSIAHRLHQFLPGAELYLTHFKDNIDKASPLHKAIETTLDRFYSSMDILTEYEDFIKPITFELLNIMEVDIVINDIFKYLMERFSEVKIEKAKLNKDKARVRINLDKIKEVFSSFVIDSKKYIEKPDKKIKLEVKIEQRSVKLIYSDNGPGIGNENKNKIFEPFFTTTGGAGLGLSIAKKIIEFHNGSISEIGKYNEGVRFEITLPIYKEDEFYG